MPELFHRLLALALTADQAAEFTLLGAVETAYQGVELTKANLVSTVFSMHFGFAGAAAKAGER